MRLTKGVIKRCARLLMRHQAVQSPIVVVIFAIGVICSPSHGIAALNNSFTFTGNGNWSIDGAGFSPNENTLFAVVPIGSFVEQAYFYAATSFNTSAPSINLAATNYSGAAWTDLGTSGIAGLRAYRTDVTQQIRAGIGNGASSAFAFVASTADTSGNLEGTVLAIVYSNPLESRRNISFYDGFVDVGGTTINHTFSSPLAPGNSGLEALVSLGIGFSAGGTAQRSTVDVNGRRLTSSAGGEDDASNSGAALTVGGLGDSPLNPPDPLHISASNEQYDDELYNLALGNAVNPLPFVNPGDRQLSLLIDNPGSHDDLDFFVGINATVPEPPGIALALGGISLLLVPRSRKHLAARSNDLCAANTRRRPICHLPTRVLKRAGHFDLICGAELHLLESLQRFGSLLGQILQSQ